MIDRFAADERVSLDGEVVSKWTRRRSPVPPPDAVIVDPEVATQAGVDVIDGGPSKCLVLGTDSFLYGRS